MGDQQLNWDQRAELCQQELYNNYWDEQTKRVVNSYPDRDSTTFHYWWYAHTLDVLIDGYERTADDWYLQKFDELYQTVYMLNGYQITNMFHDDMEWMALALLRGYQHTGKESYRRSLSTLWHTIKLGWNDHQGGGIAWKIDQIDYKNTPSNMPAVILAARMSEEFGQVDDLQWAKRIYDWQKATLVDPETGLVWDGINRLGDGQVDREWLFTYCQGVFIGGAVELYLLTQDVYYLEDAHKTAQTAIKRLTDPVYGTFVDEGHGDGGLFKGIFVRYLSQLAQVSGQISYAEILRHNADTAWVRGRDPVTGLFSNTWCSRPGRKVDLSSQLSGVMLIEQLAGLEQKGLLHSEYKD